VPTDATFWALSSAWGVRPTATLNGAAVEVVAATTSSVRIDPGPLEPDSDYVLALEYPTDGVGPNDAGPTAVTLRFRTGMSTAPPAPRTMFAGEEVIPEERQSFTGCAGELLHAQGCLDTGPRCIHTLDVSAPDVIAWIASPDVDPGGTFERDALWPASCGAPELSLYEAGPAAACLRVQAISDGGKVGDVARFCPEPARDGGAGTADAGTGQADGGVSAGGASKRAQAAARSEARRQSGDLGGCDVGTPRTTIIRTPHLLAPTLLAWLLLRRRRRFSPS